MPTAAYIAWRLPRQHHIPSVHIMMENMQQEPTALPKPWSTAWWRQGIASRNVRTALFILLALTLVGGVGVLTEVAKKQPVIRFEGGMMDGARFAESADALEEHLYAVFSPPETSLENDTSSLSDRDLEVGDSPFTTKLKELVAPSTIRRKKTFFKDWQEGRLCDAAIKVTSFRWPSRLITVNSSLYCVYPVSLS